MIDREYSELGQELGAWVMEQNSRIKSAVMNFDTWSLCGIWEAANGEDFPFTVGVSIATLEDRRIWKTFLR